MTEREERLKVAEKTMSELQQEIAKLRDEVLLSKVPAEFLRYYRMTGTRLLKEIELQQRHISEVREILKQRHPAQWRKLIGCRCDSSSLCEACSPTDM